MGLAGVVRSNRAGTPRRWERLTKRPISQREILWVEWVERGGFYVPEERFVGLLRVCIHSIGCSDRLYGVEIGQNGRRGPISQREILWVEWVERGGFYVPEERFVGLLRVCIHSIGCSDRLYGVETR